MADCAAQRYYSALAAIAAALILVSVSAADETATFNIPAQSLGSALREFAHQSNREILFSSEIVKDKTTAGVNGSKSSDAALAQLLQGTGLVTSTTPSGQILVSTADAKGASASRDPQSAPNGAENDQTASGATRPTQAQVPGRLEEVVVTAQKREERLQDVPVPVTAISAEALTESNMLRLQDYYNQIPGLTVAPASVAGYQLLSIRGISTGFANPTVGITVDDVPYGPSTVDGGNVPPDIDPGDLARVEVLRGPQGTLYGASSIGGLIKYVTVDPTTDSLSGRLQAGAEAVHNGAQGGYNVRGSLNVPLTDALAVRASAFNRVDPGYIDNPVLHINGVNKTDAYGGHLSALWKPFESVSVKLSALFQDNKAFGAADVDKTALAPTVGYVLPNLGDLQQSYVPGAGGFETKIQAYSATVRAKIGSVELTSITGFNSNTYTATTDFSYAYGQTYILPIFGVTGSPITTSPKGAHKSTEELRLSSSAGLADWLVGGFYTDENSPFPSTIYAENAQTGAIAGVFGTFNLQSTFEEVAGFADVTFHVTEKFDVQVGGRESEIHQTYQDTDTGYAAAAFDGTTYPAPYIGPEGRSKASAFTYLLTPRYKLSSDVMLYARLASGYRAGGPNVGFGVPAEYNPDKTYDYEIGLKGGAFDHRLSYDASVYYIDWKDIQTTVFAPQTGYSFTANAGGAKSQGVELSAEGRLWRGVTVNAWVAFNDAELTKPFPPGAITDGTYGAPGDRLPYAGRFSGHFAITDEFQVAAELTGTLGGEVNYVGNRLGNFQGTVNGTASGAALPRQELPGYAQTNLHVGLRYESWTMNLFLNNAFDRRGVLDGGIGTNIPYAFLYIQPRTVGLNVMRSF